MAISYEARAEDGPIDRNDADAVLARLTEGNARFVNGQSTRVPMKPEDFRTGAMGQAPLAAVLGCADSRVPPELVFDMGVGELFVVRVAGNVLSGSGPIVKGSLEYAVAELGVRVLMILGHSNCGAVAAAIKHIDNNDALPGAIGGLVDLIKPAVVAAKAQPGDKLAAVTRANVERCVVRAKEADPILAPFVKEGKLKVVGGVYDLATGKVDTVV
jgi:carbonic anhydrase